MLAMHSDVLNRTVVLRLEGLHIKVTVEDVRRSFGRVHYLVTPVAGNGSRWVDWDSVYVP